MEIQHAPPLVEPFAVADIFASGLHDVEDLGEGNYRFTFFAKQRSAYDGKSQEHVIVSKLILSNTAIFHFAKLALRAVGARCCGAVIDRRQH